MAYAAVSDIEARWRTLSDSEQARAAVLLDDAAAILDAFVTVDATDEEQAALLKQVSCSMVIRAMSATETDSFGVSQSSMTAGPYSQSWTYANPSGDMYLTKLEKRLLGITQGYISTIEPKIDGWYGDNDD